MLFQIPGVVLRLLSCDVFDGTINLDGKYLCCHGELSTQAVSHGIDQRLIVPSPSLLLPTSGAAASDHLRWQFNGNSGKCKGEREPRPGNGDFMVCNCPGVGNGPKFKTINVN